MRQVQWLNRQHALTRMNEARLLELLEIRSTVVGAVGKTLALNQSLSRLRESRQERR